MGRRRSGRQRTRRARRRGRAAESGRATMREKIVYVKQILSIAIKRLAHWSGLGGEIAHMRGLLPNSAPPSPKPPTHLFPVRLDVCCHCVHTHVLGTVGANNSLSHNQTVVPSSSADQCQANSGRFRELVARIAGRQRRHVSRANKRAC
jgi:hypothetical protein